MNKLALGVEILNGVHMRSKIAIMAICAISLGGCGGSLRDSVVNPSNWFKKRNAQKEATQTNPLIPRNRAGGLFKRDTSYKGSLIQSVDKAIFERVSDGAIVRVYATSARAGAYNVQFDTIETSLGTATLQVEMKAILPERAIAETPNGRSVIAAVFIDSHTLSGLRSIEIVSATVSQTVRVR